MCEYDNYTVSRDIANLHERLPETQQGSLCAASSKHPPPPPLWHATVNEFLLKIGCTCAHAAEKPVPPPQCLLPPYVDDATFMYLKISLRSH